jgi:hypothetical protein
VEGRSTSPAKAWDEFFSDFYLRAYAEEGVVQTTQTLIEGTGARESRTFTVRVYTATELVAMLGRAGFSQVRCLGGLDAAPFTTATRLVIVAAR